MPGSFAERLKQIRELRGASIRRLAAAAELNPGSIHRMEQGEFVPKRAIVDRLARALDVLPAELLGSEGELPMLRPYLRAAYGMDDNAAADVERFITERYGVGDSSHQQGGE
jgi:transcriptional regulator with XRE-family HTH domain